MAAAPGRRVPRTVDEHELAVRAVLGQQVSTAAARTHAARLVRVAGTEIPDPAGGLTHLFPTAGAVAEVDPELRVLASVEELRRVTRTATGEITATSMLERFGFTGDRLTTRVGDLSGGERRRLQILRLLLTEPDWLREPPGHDVLGAAQWIPFITFWQVTADLPFATEVPGGHGHKYTSEYVDAWATVLQPAGWTEAKAQQLRELIAGE